MRTDNDKHVDIGFDCFSSVNKLLCELWAVVVVVVNGWVCRMSIEHTAHTTAIINDMPTVNFVPIECLNAKSFCRLNFFFFFFFWFDANWAQRTNEQSCCMENGNLLFVQYIDVIRPDSRVSTERIHGRLRRTNKSNNEQKRDCTRKRWSGKKCWSCK